MALKASEISQLIKERIENFEAASEARDVGTVIALTDGIVRIHGLADARYGEMLEFPGNTFGLALNIEQDSVGAVVLGEYKHISEGDTVKTTGRILEVPVGRGLLGRVVDALGNPIDGKGPIEADGSFVLSYDSPDERRPAPFQLGPNFGVKKLHRCNVWMVFEISGKRDDFSVAGCGFGRLRAQWQGVWVDGHGGLRRQLTDSGGVLLRGREHEVVAREELLLQPACPRFEESMRHVLRPRLRRRATRVES